MKKDKPVYLSLENKSLPLKTNKKAKFFPYQYSLDKGGKKTFRSEKRMAILLVPNSQCTNRCIFCEPNIPLMEKLVNAKLSLSAKPNVKNILKEAKKLYLKNKDIKEIVIGAGIGEPLLYFKDLLSLILLLKKELGLPIRLNTNGQASVILKQNSTKEICKSLENVGLNIIMISLNAITEEEYNFLCKPKLKGSFKSVIKFIEECNKGNIKTLVSFLDYPKGICYPKLDKKKINKFITSLGLKESQIVYRPIFLDANIRKRKIK